MEVINCRIFCWLPHFSGVAWTGWQGIFRTKFNSEVKDEFEAPRWDTRILGPAFRTKVTEWDSTHHCYLLDPSAVKRLTVTSSQHTAGPPTDEPVLCREGNGLPLTRKNQWQRLSLVLSRVIQSVLYDPPQAHHLLLHWSLHQINPTCSSNLLGWEVGSRFGRLRG